MKILFSPSEAKSTFCDSRHLNKNSFFMPELFEHRLHVAKSFNQFLEKSDITDLQKLFGLKDEDACYHLKKTDILHSCTCRAIDRYTGVAFEYLDFNSLLDKEKEYLLNNLVIFSNLFGPMLAKDEVPVYKFKQGSSIGDFKPEKFYKENFSSGLDKLFTDELVIDLRAGFYEKFYTIKKSYITMKFMKNGKVVSHWAKAYRGKVLRELAQYQPNTLEEFEKINFMGLELVKVLHTKLKKEYVFNILG
jgi:hypothetical protein